MSGEFKHKAVGPILDQTEYEGLDAHGLDGQQVGDLIYASSTTQLSRRAIGAEGAVFKVVNSVPTWVSSLAHDELSGLGDDDHTQYLLASGARVLSGDLDFGNYRAKQVYVVELANIVGDPAGLADGHLWYNTTADRFKGWAGAATKTLAFTSEIVTDHGGLSGLGDDDHTQYLKKAGGTMTGVLNFGGYDPVIGANDWGSANHAHAAAASGGAIDIADTFGTLAVGRGGSGGMSFTDHGILLGSGSSQFSVTAEPTNGQLLIGKTGYDPVLATLDGGLGITVVNQAGAVTIDHGVVISGENLHTNYLQKSGGTMTGDLDMGGQDIEDVDEIEFSGNRELDPKSNSQVTVWFVTRQLDDSTGVDHKFNPRAPASSSVGWGYMGDSNDWWYKVYSQYFYGKNTSIQSFDSMPDEALVKAIRVRQHADEKTGRMREIFDPATFPPEVKDETGEFLDLGSFTGLLLGTIRKLIGRVEQLEVQANRGNPNG